jgi:hypothetical protein
MKKEIEIRKSYIYFKVTGLYPGYESTISVIKEIVELTKKHNINKILIDLSDIQDNPKIIEHYDLGEKAARIWGHFLKIALLNRADKITGLFENVAVNRGANVRVLSNFEQAELWLNDD